MLASLWAMAPAFANPEGGVVTAGSASIGGQGSTRVTVTAPGKSVIEWKSFSNAKGESVEFRIDGGVSLNRVVGGSGGIPKSVIDGVIKGDGHVMLVNPSGIAGFLVVSCGTQQ